MLISDMEIATNTKERKITSNIDFKLNSSSFKTLNNNLKLID